MKNIRQVMVLAATLGAATLLAVQAEDLGKETVRIMVPSTPGASWDVIAQAVAKALEAEGLAGKAEVYYGTAGESGTKGLREFVKLKGDGKQLFSTGVGTVAGSTFFKSPVALGDLTPIARLTNDFETISVPANSPYKTIADVVAAMKANPASVRWSGTGAGGVAHLVAGLVAQEVGLSGAQVKFVNSSGADKALKAMLQNESDICTTPYSNVEDYIKAGQVRALAITAADEDGVVKVPTLVSQGINVTFSSWKGIMAPPGLNPQDRIALQLMFSKLVRSPTWRKTLKENNWKTYFQTGESFRLFLQKEQSSADALLRNLDLIK